MLKFVIPQRDEDLFQQVDDAYYVSSNIEDNEYIEEALQRLLRLILNEINVIF